MDPGEWASYLAELGDNLKEKAAILTPNKVLQSIRPDALHRLFL